MTRTRAPTSGQPSAARALWAIRFSPKTTSFVRWALVVVVIGLAIRTLNWPTIWTTLLRIQPLYAAIALALGSLTVVGTAVKLQLALGFRFRVSFWKTLRSVLEGKVYGFLIPGSIGTDIATLASVHRHTGHAVSISTIFILERSLSLLALLFLTVALLPVSAALLPIHAGVFLVGIVGLGALGGISAVFAVHAYPSHWNRLVQRWEWTRNAGSAVKEILSNVATSKMRTALIFGAGIALNVNIQVGNYFLLRAAHADIDLLSAVAILPLCSLALFFPITANGIGIREATIFYLLSPQGISLETIITACVLGYFFDGVLLIFCCGSILTDRHPCTTFSRTNR